MGRPDWALLLRFGLVGLLNTAFSYVVFVLLLAATQWPDGALVGAALAGVAFNFQTLRRLVFRSRGNVLRFVAVYLAVLTLNAAGLRALRLYGLSDRAAQAALTLPVAALAFAGQRGFVFPRAAPPA